MIGYKGFDKDMMCRGYRYEVGKTYKMEEPIELCSSGFHFCKNMADCFKYYNGDNCRYAKIEALGYIEEGDDKCVTNVIKILEEIPAEDAIAMSNTGHSNTGNWNTGDCNTGDCNTGNWNTGNCNTGDCNSGNRNVGSCNTGKLNTGRWNTGDKNTGNGNAGNFNTGHSNIGSCNTGDCNTGNCNTGSWNIGNYNTGDWNTVNNSSGCFNTIQQNITMFNRPSGYTLESWKNSRAYLILSRMPQEIDVIEWVLKRMMSDAEKAENPTYKTVGGYIKVTKSNVSKQEWWDGLMEDEKQAVKDIENFDADIFYECTGIEVN